MIAVKARKRAAMGLLVLLTAFLPACSTDGTPLPTSPSGETTSPASTPSTPLPDMSLDVSFPDGVPPLNETAALVCTITTRANSGLWKDIGVSFVLPDAFELVSGETSWKGDIAPASNITALNAVLKSVKTGNYTINLEKTFPRSDGSFGKDAFPIYVKILENSAEWNIYRSYDIPEWQPSTDPPPPTDVPIPATEPSPFSPSSDY